MSLRPKDMTDGDEKQLAVDCALFFGDNSIKELEFYSPTKRDLSKYWQYEVPPEDEL